MINVKARSFRELLKNKKPLVLAGAHNGLTAKLVEEAGFDGVWASGLEISCSYGVPDAGILTMKEFLESAMVMNEAVLIPVIADCDTGFGNSNNVIHMVKKYESAGIAGVVIEDKAFPKQNSLLFGGRQELASIGEFVGKIMAAKNAQQTEDFMVIARIEALIAGWGIEEAIKRADAYVKAGADAILIHSKSKSPQEVINFLESWEKKVPIVIVPTTYNEVTIEELKKFGVDIVIYANYGIRTIVKAVRETFREILKDGTTKYVEKKIVPLSEIFELQGMPQLKENERKFVKTDTSDIVALIPAAGSHKEAENMQEILGDRPLAMIDINGKPLLKWNINTMKICGINDFVVVGGYKADRIPPDELEVKLVVNNEYQDTYILDSIVKGMENVEEGKDILLVYSDIYFDSDIIRKIIQKRSDFVIAVGPIRREKSGYKSLDLVITEKEPIKSDRFISINRKNHVCKIGTKLSLKDAFYEFIGITYLNSEGVKIFKQIYEDCKNKYTGKPFHEAYIFEKASLTDFLQELVDRGMKIDTLEVRSGWMEIYSFEDYKLICSFLK